MSRRVRGGTGVSGDLQQPVQFGERGSEGNRLIVGHRDHDDAREGAGEFGKLTVLPVTAVRGHNLSERSDQAGAIIADNGEN